MYAPLVVAVLLSCCAGEAWGDTVPTKIQVFAGETAVLPCSTPVRDVHPTVEWSQVGLDRGIALLFRDGCETHEEKNPVFRYRTSLIMNELKNGNISLRISNAQLSDAGTYKCKTIRQGVQKDVMVELSVGVVSEPKLSTVPAVGGGVTLQCEANLWFPRPEITLVDDQGNEVDAEEQKDYQDSSGHFNVSRRMTVQTHHSRIFCKVHQPQTNQTRVAEIYIPDECMKSCTTMIAITAVVTILLCALIAVTCWKCGQSDRGQNSRRATREELLRRIDELKLSPSEEEMMIRQLFEKQVIEPASENSLSSSVSKPVAPPPQQVPRPNNPKPVASTSSSAPKSGSPPQNKDLNPCVSVQNPAPAPPIQRSIDDRSSPASPGNAALPPSLSFSAFAPEGSVIGRSQSVSRPRANSNKPQRRNTFSAVPTNPINTNRFGPLADLREDIEPLLE